MPTEAWKKKMTGSGNPIDMGVRWCPWQSLETFIICGRRAGQDLEGESNGENEVINFTPPARLTPKSGLW